MRRVCIARDCAFCVAMRRVAQTDEAVRQRAAVAHMNHTTAGDANGTIGTEARAQSRRDAVARWLAKQGPSGCTPLQIHEAFPEEWPNSAAVCNFLLYWMSSRSDCPIEKVGKGRYRITNGTTAPAVAVDADPFRGNGAAAQGAGLSPADPAVAQATF